MTEPKFKTGDQVIINHGVLAEIVHYDELANSLIYVTKPAGGGTNTTTAHVSNTRIDPVPSLDDALVLAAAEAEELAKKPDLSK